MPLKQDWQCLEQNDTGGDTNSILLVLDYHQWREGDVPNDWLLPVPRVPVRPAGRVSAPVYAGDPCHPRRVTQQVGSEFVTSHPRGALRSLYSCTLQLLLY